MRRPPTLLAALAALVGLGLVLWLVAGGPDAPPETPLGNTPEETPGATDPDLLRTADGDAPIDAPSPAEADALSLAPQPTTLTGEIRDERGRGIGGATVEVRRIDLRSLRGAPYPDGPTLRSVQTERDGTFAIENLAGDWLRLTAHAPGRARIGERVASTGAYVVIVLPPAGALSIEVLDHEGRPLAGAEVETRADQTVTSLVTDAAGRALLPDAAPGAVRLRAAAAGHGTALAGPFLVHAGETTEALVRLPRAIEVAGVVRDTAGRPLADAEVHIARPGRNERVEVDAQGRFGPVSAGGLGERVFLAAAADGHAPRLEPVILRADGVQEILLELAPAAAWQGRVVDARGAPVAGATVAYTGDGASDGEQPGGVTTRSDAEGRFTLPPPRAPAPGRRVVLAARKGAALGALALRPDILQPDPLLLVLETGVVVSGRTTDAAGRPLGGIVVRLTPAWEDVPRPVFPDAAASRLLLANEERSLGVSTATRSDGAWAMAGVPAGPYRVYFEHRGTTERRADVLQVADLPVSAGTQVLGGGRTLLGEVVDARGRPVAAAQISLLREDGVPVRTWSATDAEGAFEIAGLVGARYRVVVTAAGRAQARATADLTEDETLSLRIALDDPAVLEADVTRAGAPYTGVLTIAFADAGTGRAVAQRRTVRVTDGTLELRDAPAGLWTVDALVATSLRARVPDVRLDAGRMTRIRLDLDAGAVLTGRVHGADDRAAGGAYVTLSHPATGTRLAATSDAQGRFRFENLAPGTYTLEIVGRGGAPIRETLDLDAGRRADRTFHLAPSGTLEVRVLDARGTPLREVRLSFQTPDGIVRLLRPARTDAAGRAVQPDLPAGSLLVRAQGPDGAAGSAQALVTTGDTTRVEVRVSAAPR